TADSAGRKRRGAGRNGRGAESFPVRVKRVTALIPAVAVVLIASACGGSSSSSTRAPVTTAAATSATTTSPPPPRIVTRSPRKGAHTGQNLTVRVALLGTAPPSSSFRYVLDGRFTRHG